MKLFNKYDLSGIVINDPGLKGYINLDPLLVPKTTGRNTSNRFWKAKYNIVERLMNKLMVPGHKGKKHKLTSGSCTGKGLMVYKIVQKTFDIIEGRLKKNPVEVFVKALENAAPREEITTIEYGGARYPQAVECAPLRRVDIALRQMVQGSYSRCFNKKVRIEEVLAEEIIKAYNTDQGSQAISKKLELERQADSSR
ncbi:30S ribosomal protein S7 [Candidatus Woesearchaeota archaeon]|nr:30S ribosomal protein S7 [Candidatus Woesearchaeota archaeon]